MTYMLNLAVAMIAAFPIVIFKIFVVLKHSGVEPSLSTVNLFIYTATSTLQFILPPILLFFVGISAKKKTYLYTALAFALMLTLSVLRNYDITGIKYFLLTVASSLLSVIAWILYYGSIAYFISKTLDKKFSEEAQISEDNSSSSLEVASFWNQEAAGTIVYFTIGIIYMIAAMMLSFISQ